jgi:ferritin-like metal-binding protein YciE
MTKAKTLQDLFHDTFKDIYFAEKKIMSAAQEQWGKLTDDGLDQIAGKRE